MPKTVAGDKEKKKGKTQQAQHLAAFYTPKPVGGGGGEGGELRDTGNTTVSH